VTQP